MPSSNPWLVAADGWNAEQVTHHGNLFLLGNGYMGCRGTLEEFGPDEKVGLLLPGLYDRVGGAWREPVNAPNGFFTRVAVNGTWLNPLQIKPVAHRQALDMRAAMHHRESRFSLSGAEVVITAERFLSAAEINLMAMRYTVRVQGACELTLETGVDERVWDLNGPHLENIATVQVKDALLLTARTHEKGDTVAVAERSRVTGVAASSAESRVGALRRWSFRVSGDTTLELVKFASVFSSLDTAAGLPAEAAVALVDRAERDGYAAVRSAHAAVWQERWNRADVVVEGDDAGQHALRYSLYQLLSAAPFHSEQLSIPARALSGQVYKGAIFWDTEIFMFPFFLAVFPEVARNLVRYRIHTLAGARAKAAEYGCVGAYYPWEGQEGGYDACTLFNITDVFTNRPMRTYFRDKQIHISGDVAWAIWQYVEATDDVGLLRDGGWDVMLECSRFFFSYAYRRTTRDQYVLLDVTGPDEYHERVANNAYTNHLAQYVVRATLEATQRIAQEFPAEWTAQRARLGFDAAEEARLADFAAKLVLPQPDPRTQVIEQFDGYHGLEDCALQELKSRILHPSEYLGGGSGLASTTKIIKQADVVLLLHLLPGRFSAEVKKANWDFYEPRTEHGSSLSPCVYALVAAETGRLDFAYQYFLKTATVDLTGHSKQYVGTLYIGGTHPAANGGAWMVAAQGFGGLRFGPEGLLIQPRLPPAWKSLSFNVTYRGCRLHLHLTQHHQQVRVESVPASKRVSLNLNGRVHLLQETSTITST